MKSTRVLLAGLLLTFAGFALPPAPTPTPAWLPARANKSVEPGAAARTDATGDAARAAELPAGWRCSTPWAW